MSASSKETNGSDREVSIPMSATGGESERADPSPVTASNSSTAAGANHGTDAAAGGDNARNMDRVDLELGLPAGGASGAAAGRAGEAPAEETRFAGDTASAGGTQLQRSASDNLDVHSGHRRWGVPRPGLTKFLSIDHEPPARPQPLALSRSMSLHPLERQLSELEEERPVETTVAKLLEMGFAMGVIEQALASGAATVEEAMHAIYEVSPEHALPDEVLDHDFVAAQQRILDELREGAGAAGAGAMRAGHVKPAAPAPAPAPAEDRSAHVASARARGEAVVECEICMEDVVQSEMEGAGCGHSFCSDCWAAFLNSAIRNGEVLHITCPQAGCGREIGEGEIKAKVDGAVFEKYQRFYKEARLRLNPNARFCPTAGCGEVVIGNRFSKRLHCPKCDNDFCYRCNEPWHEGRSCEDAQDALFAQHKAENHIRGCPRCAVPIFKLSGCNHITCTRCGHNYCYLCGGVYFGGVHFASWNIFGCRGRQFDSEPPLPPGRARLKRWTWHVALVIGCLVALAIGVSMLVNPILLFCVCCFVCANVAKPGLCRFGD